MSFVPPSVDKIKEAFPEVTDLALFAQGGFKAVYSCFTQRNNEVFKLVGLPPAGLTDEEKAFRLECLGRIRRELELLGNCQRPEIVKLGSVQPRQESIEGIDYVGYTEELLHGPNLEDAIKKDSPPTEQECRRLMLALVIAIQELWGKFKAVHRDIKPGNIVKLAQPERPFVLLDLGIAFGVEGTALTVGASHRFPVATYRYFAPEMAKPDFRQNLDYRADLYAAALTVFEYSAQKHPLADKPEDIFQSVTRAISQTPILLKVPRPDFSNEFCEIIDQMLKKKPALRPGNLTRLREFLERDI
jgi:serine/threonine protein kinase